MVGSITELFNNINASLTPPDAGSISFGDNFAVESQPSLISSGQLTTQPIGVTNPSPSSSDFAGVGETGFETGSGAFSALGSEPIIAPETKLGSLLRVATQPLTNTGSLRMIP